jgi:DNA-binding response OmpR family regulator
MLDMNAQILVVDDEPDISALVAYHLARAAYRVQTAADGSEALKVVERQAPDLIVLDLMLPGLSGIDVLRELKRRPETQTVPIILLTARREESDRIQGLELGADDYVAKPFSPQELVLRIARRRRTSLTWRAARWVSSPASWVGASRMASRTVAKAGSRVARRRACSARRSAVAAMTAPYRPTAAVETTETGGGVR